MREEYGANSLFNQLLHWKFINDSYFNQMLKNDFLSENMHIFPVDSRLQDSLHSFLCLINCIVNFLLLFGELSINGKSDRNVSAVSVPFAAHVMQSHLTWLVDLVVLYVMKSGAVPSTWADGMETSSVRARFVRVFEFKYWLGLDLFQSRSCWLQSRNVSIRSDFAHIPHQPDLVIGLDSS